MTAPADTVDPVVAVAVHVLLRARDNEALAAARMRQAVDGVIAAGLTLEAVDRVVRLLHTDPVDLEAEEQETGRVLAALRPPGIEFDTIEIIERRLDETREARRERVWRGGWIAAVLSSPVEVPPDAEEASIWMAGYRAFQAALRAHEAQDRRQNDGRVASARKKRERQAVAA